MSRVGQYLRRATLPEEPDPRLLGRFAGGCCAATTGRKTPSGAGSKR